MVSRSWATTVTAWWPKKRVCSEILHRAAKFVESDLAIIILVNLVAEKWWKLIARDDPILVLVMSIEDILRSTETSAWTILSRRSFIKRGIVVGRTSQWWRKLTLVVISRPARSVENLVKAVTYFLDVQF